MANLKDWVLEAANGEKILGVVLGLNSWEYFFRDRDDDTTKIPLEKVLSWEDALQLIDFDFDDSYGSPGCPAIHVWTDSTVIAVYCYDGATGWFSVPRNPIDCAPCMPGGG